MFSVPKLIIALLAVANLIAMGALVLEHYPPRYEHPGTGSKQLAKEIMRRYDDLLRAWPDIAKDLRGKGYLRLLKSNRIMKIGIYIGTLGRSNFQSSRNSFIRKGGQIFQKLTRTFAGSGSTGGLGGAEQSVAVLAEALSSIHQVDIIHHNSKLTAKRLAEFTGTNLDLTRLRFVSRATSIYDFRVSAPQLCREWNNWSVKLSAPYDLFIAFTHSIPPKCYASKGVLRSLFPRPIPSHLAGMCKDHLESYFLKVANSSYTRTWTQRRWNVDCQVIYSPVNTNFQAVEKSNVVLSVGRFLGKGLSKKQLEMISTFGHIGETRMSGWQYFSVGSLDSSSEAREYFRRVHSAGNNCGAHVLANVELAFLKRLYEQAKIFWHAAGYGEDCDKYPELAEHFGIVTAEAMAAGCVPNVINKGGPAEIVKHGENGFLWDTLEELKEYTLLLARDEQLLAQMSKAARSYAAHFGRAEYIKHFFRLIDA